MTKKVLATVNGREITQSDMDMLVRTLGPQRAAQFSSEQGQSQLLDELVNQELFYNDAVEQNLQEDEVYKEELRKASEQILKQYAIQKLLAEVSIEDDAIQAFYESNKDHYKAPEMVEASHILVDTSDEAKNIILEITEGLTFEDAAQKYSKCPSKENGGNLGKFGKGQMVPEFEKRAFELAIGEMSEPVQTQFGFHIIKTISKQDADQKSFDEVQDQIRNELLIKAQNDLYFNKVSELKAKYEIKITE